MREIRIPWLNVTIKREAKGTKKPKSLAVGLGYRTVKTRKPKFKDMIAYYDGDPNIKGAIDELAESSVGNGGHLTAAEGEDQVLGITKDWLEEIDLDTRNLTFARELWLTGNTITEQVKPPPKLERLVHVPIKTIVGAKYVDKHGKIDYYQQVVEGGGRAKLKPKDVLHWRWNSMSDPNWGIGLVHSLLTIGLGYVWKDANNKYHYEHRPSFQQCLEEMEDSMRKAVRKYVPRYHYIFKGFSDDEAKEHAGVIQGLAPEDDLYLSTPNMSKQEIEIVRMSTDPRSRLHPFIEYYDDARTKALQTPTLRLFLEAGFTEASARTAVAVLDRKVGGFQRKLKRDIERDIIKPYVMQTMKWKGKKGLKEYRKTKLRWNWGQIEAPKLEMNHIVNLIKLSAEQLKDGKEPIISVEEARKILADYGLPITAIENEKKEK